MNFGSVKNRILGLKGYRKVDDDAVAAPKEKTSFGRSISNKVKAFKIGKMRGQNEPIPLPSLKEIPRIHPRPEIAAVRAPSGRSMDGSRIRASRLGRSKVLNPRRTPPAMVPNGSTNQGLG